MYYDMAKSSVSVRKFSTRFKCNIINDSFGIHILSTGKQIQAINNKYSVNIFQ